MKKRIALVGVTVMFGFGLFLWSCEKEEKNCSCTVYDNSSGWAYWKSIGYDIKPSSFGASSCSDVAIKLRQTDLLLGIDNEYRCR